MSASRTPPAPAPSAETAAAPTPSAETAASRTPPAPAPLRLATRRSALAMAQSRAIGELLAELTGRPLEIVEVTTQGDVDPGSLAQIGGTGVFVAAVRQALVDGRADVAVHSLKDLPTTPDTRLELAAIPPREDPRDVLVARDGARLDDLPVGARVGTGSPRRRAQLAAARPDLDLVDIRGNVDTRVARVLGTPGAAVGALGGAEAGDLDGVVLAAAGLSRLGRTGIITEHLEPELVMPAPGQGALAIEVRAHAGAGDAALDHAARDHAAPDHAALVQAALVQALRSIDDPDTRAEVTAEREVLATLEAGCSAPIGVLARVVRGDAGPTLHVRTVLARPDGSLVRTSSSGPVDEAEQVGRTLALDLLADPTIAGAAMKSPDIQDRAIHRGEPNR